jgi:hypothetical protein
MGELPKALIMETTNPAYRLLNILKRLKHIGGDAPVRDGWAIVLEITADDDLRLHNSIANILLLVKKVQASMLPFHKISDKSEMITALNLLASVVSGVGLDDNWSKIENAIGEKSPVFRRVEFIANLLENSPAQESVDYEAISRVQNLINELLHEVQSYEDDQINRDLREFLVEQLKQMRSAMADYIREGSEALDRRLSVVVGNFYTDRRYREHPDELPETVQKVFAIINAAGSLATIAYIGVPLIPSTLRVAGFLP